MTYGKINFQVPRVGFSVSKISRQRLCDEIFVLISLGRDLNNLIIHAITGNSVPCYSKMRTYTIEVNDSNVS